ncbi:MAG TPA: DUF1015 family protein [Kiritimatiellia bacterium]|jgi:uncharacterized protein (DUF1015 family)
MQIRAFKALRPPVELAPKVASLPYDVGDLATAREEASKNAMSFLHVERPEVDLADGFDPSSGVQHTTASKNLQHFRQKGWLVQDERPSLYLYRQTLGGHSQRGIMACCSCTEYDQGVIRRHEKTKKPTEDERARHVDQVGAQTGPVFLIHKDDPGVAALAARIEATKPQVDFTAGDGIGHTIWPIPDVAEVEKLFAGIPRAYIADGHHRAAAAARVARERGGEGEHRFFMAALFPASELKVLPYNRIIRDFAGMKAEQFLRRVNVVFDVTENGAPAPAASRSVGMYFGGKWYGLAWYPEKEATDPVTALDVSVLQERLLGPVLGIDDPRTNQRIEYVGGLKSVEELKRKVDTGQAAVGFSMFPTTVAQLMAISDLGQIMPPKSTWFEPKLRSGLFVHAL